MPQETFYSGGAKSADAIARYNTPIVERRNVVCESIRIALRLTAAQADGLSTDGDFASYFLARQKAYVCETIGKPLPRCGSRP
jgi:hypothetical protein